jgi:hypothetical protein
VTATEGHQYLQTLNGYIADGKSKEEIQALDNARFLKNGGTVSNATKEKWLAQFEEYNIAKSAYTPTEGDTTAGTGWSALLKEALPSLIGSLQNNGSSSSSYVSSLTQMPSLASMSGGLPGMPQLGMPSMETLAGFPFKDLNGQSFNPFLPSQALGTNVFGGASAINSSTLNPLLAGSAGLPTAFNPLTAGSAQQPFAQTNFVPSVGVAPAVAPSGFAFTPAALTTPPVATVGTAPVNPAVDPWAAAGSTAGAVPLNLSGVPATPTLLAQARPPQALPQAPASNGGW